MKLGREDIMGLLSYNEIVEFNLIPDLDKTKDHKPAASCDLCVGDRHYLFESTGYWKPVFLGSPSELEIANQKSRDPSLKLQLSDYGNDRLVIPPFCSAIIQLKEAVDLYTVATTSKIMIAGRFDLKLSAIYKGLISQQATQVEPCYRGMLYCFVHNLGKQEVTLKKDEKIATIEFYYVGQERDKEERTAIINETIVHNMRKYGDESFSYKDHTGIGDIRWLKVYNLPRECGIAPIYSLVNGNINDHVDKYLEKSSTIESLSDRVSNRLKEKENLFKILLALILAVISFFTTNLIIEIRAELRYFSEELSFFADLYESTNPTTPEPDSAPTPAPTNGDNPISTDDPNTSADYNNSGALAAIRAHTQELSDLRMKMFMISGVFLAVTVVVLIIFFFTSVRPSGEQKWIGRRKMIEAKREYFRIKREYDEMNKNNKQEEKAKENQQKRSNKKS